MLLKSSFYLIWLCHGVGGILASPPGFEPVPLAMEAWSLNHWTIREFPEVFILNGWISYSVNFPAIRMKKMTGLSLYWVWDTVSAHSVYGRVIYHQHRRLHPRVQGFVAGFVPNAVISPHTRPSWWFILTASFIIPSQETAACPGLWLTQKEDKLV